MYILLIHHYKNQNYSIHLKKQLIWKLKIGFTKKALAVIHLLEELKARKITLEIFRPLSAPKDLKAFLWLF